MQQPAKENEARIKVGLRMLAGGSMVSMADVGLAWIDGNPTRGFVSIISAATLLLLIPVLNRTKSFNLVFGIAAVLACSTCLVFFTISGAIFFLAIGMSIPIGATICTSPKLGLGIGIAYALVSLLLTLGLSYGWYIPPYGSGQMMRSPIAECLIILLTMSVLCGSSIFRETVIERTQRKRMLSDASLQKQLAGLRLLAETTTELLSVEPTQERWTELLDRIATHLDCQLFTNYEVASSNLRLVASTKLPPEVFEVYQSLDFGEKTCGLCAMHRSRVHLTTEEMIDHPQASDLYAMGLRCVAVEPLLFGDRLVGTLGFASSTKSQFANEELDFLTTLGQSVATVRGRALSRSERRASDSRFRRVVDHAAHSFFQIDSEMRFLDVNQQACLSLGYEREELLQLKLQDVVVGLTESRRDEIESILLKEHVWSEKELYRRKDGTEYPVELHLSRVKLDGVDHVIALAQDTSDRQQLADRMIQSQKMEAIGRLAGGVAHDFNNLLCVINSYSEQLMDEPTLSEMHRSWMRSIFEAAQHGAGLTRQLLVFGRQAVFKPKIIDLNAVVVDAQRLLDRLIGENIILESKLTSLDCGIMADRTQIDQVLINLAVNARDAMPQGGKLTLQTRHITTGESGNSEAQVQLCVSDSGIGISPEIQAKIFDPFFTTKGVGEGTGLGLSVAYGIVHESGGTIDVASQPGKGSTFTISLPHHTLVPSETALQPPAPHFKLNKLVLLVEDEPAVMRATSLSLKQLGYYVLEANSASQAIELAEQHAGEIGMLLSDVVMPDQNGPDLVREIAKILPDLRVLYMTGYTPDVIDSITDLGQDRMLLQKPFSSQELSERIQEVLSQTGSQHSDI